MAAIVGRQQEQQLFSQTLKSKEAELIAVYGRRRVGKTYLIHNYYKPQLVFELTGMHNGSMKEQLLQFSRAFQKATASPLTVKPPANWVEAFTALEQFLSAKSKKEKCVVFFDEFPWLDSRKSGFLSAFEHFWNTWASRQENLIVIICGSAASWMISNVVNSKGGLHNRITRKIRLLPFTLGETKAYLESRSIKIDPYQILQMYMAFGGVPHYLKNAERGESATQTIDTACFTKDGNLRDEFEQLYRSLFDVADNHLKTVRALAQAPKGLTRQEIIDVCGLTSGGRASIMLQELEESGFIQATVPYQKTSKEALYRLTDEFSLFHLKFMDKKKSGDQNAWVKISAMPVYKIWCGMAFEAVCLKHITNVKKALGIDGIHSEDGAWRYNAGKGETGAQIDLLIDRADRTINICEMKFYNGEFVIDKSYASELERKLTVFVERTKTRKSLFLTMITTYGIKENEYAARLVQKILAMDVLFN